jgi:hypothetical protein
MLDLARIVKEMTGSSSEIVLIPYDKAYEEGFEDPFLPNGVRQFLEFGFVKMLAGLRWIGGDLFNPTIEEGL